MRNALSFFLSLSLTFAGSGCSTAHEKTFSDKITEGRCDEALIELPERDPLVHLTSQTKQAADTVLSYTFVGASYTAEVLWDVAGGTVMVIALCAVPLAVIGGMYAASNSSATYSNTNSGPQPLICIPGKITALGAPPLGRQSLEATKEMRCPDLKSLSHSIRRVAACFETKGGKDDLEKAEKSLKALQNSQQFYQCLPLDEQQKISNQLVMIQDRRAAK
jgi:hypothetical protein